MLYSDDSQTADYASTPGPGGDGSFTGAGNSSSIGDGTSDQGFEPGQEQQDDEFRHGNDATGSPDIAGKEDILEGENEHHAPPPTHGLVEEGPGPDA